MIKKVFNFLLIFFPWSLRRYILNNFYKYNIHKESKIGFSYVYPKYLELGKEARIDHLTVAVHLDKVVLGSNSKIGRGNWITGFSTKSASKHFIHQLDRSSSLIIGENSAITKNHHIDCTNVIQIGNFVTIAGYASQLLTHSINIEKNIQDSHPITIGDYCFVGTGSTLLGGAVLPPYSVLGAKSLLRKPFTTAYRLYGGNPAKEIKELSKDFKYFNRKEGFVF